MDDIEQWLDQTFGPLVASANDLNSPPEGALIVVNNLVSCANSVASDAISDARMIDGGIPKIILEGSVPAVVKAGKSVSGGNNRYGRRGKQRCWECRKWKQKVSPHVIHGV
jgi:hypothetical protein